MWPAPQHIIHPLQRFQESGANSRADLSKLLFAGALARIALWLRHRNALLHTTLLLHVVLNAGLRRDSVGFVLAERVLRVGVPSLCVRARDAKPIAIYNTFVDLIAFVVDEAGTGLVAGGEGDLAFHFLDLVVIEKVAVLVAVLDLLLGDSAFRLELLFARSEVNILLRVFSNWRRRADGGLRGCGSTGGDNLVTSILSVLFSQSVIVLEVIEARVLTLS